MDWSAVAAWGEVAGAVAVVISLLYLSAQIRQSVRGHLGDQVFQIIIPRNVRLAESPSFGKPILLYAVRSKGADSYLQLEREILSKMAPLEEKLPYATHSIGVLS